MKNLLILIFAFAAYPCMGQKKNAQEFYEIRIINISSTEQEARNDQYLEQALVPALHRAGIKTVGVFKPVQTDTVYFGKRIYLIIPYQSPDQFTGIQEILSKDKEHLAKGKAYLESPYNSAPFDRIESILLKAFRDMPRLNKPNFSTPREERIYELRSYESHSQKIYKNKEKMFNEGGEIRLFARLQFNAVFYAEALAGTRLPNLMYMTSFENMAARDAHWKSFVNDPEWKKLSSMPEYQNNVSKINIYFLTPTTYSDL